MGSARPDRHGLGAYSNYSGGPRVGRMAAVLAASCDAMDVVSVPEADEAIGSGYYGSVNVLKAAVRCGLMRATGLPKEYNGKVYRTTYAATEDGFRWLDGYREHVSRAKAERAEAESEADEDRRAHVRGGARRRVRGRRRLPRKRVSAEEAMRRLVAKESEVLSRAMESMRTRIAERDAERRLSEGIDPPAASGKAGKKAGKQKHRGKEHKGNALPQ